VDRAAVGTTTVGRGTKIDNLAQVGHGCHVGEDTLLCGQVGLAGSTEVGNRVTLAGQVGVAGHLKIADGATVAAQAGVMEPIEDSGTYAGSPATGLREQIQIAALLRRLPELAKKVKELERRLAAFEGKGARTP
jgi:UDP-3-O-[3-hydroxymyristoyl] glucosamine N-acyltransferase